MLRSMSITAFNVWPAPLAPVANMAKANQASHDECFANYAADDYGTESKKQLASEVVETDYRVDRSVEQVVKGEGAIERMTVSVMVPRAVDAVTLKAIRQLVANAVGLREGRGDAIEVSSLPVAPAAAPTGATTAGAAVAPGAPRAPLGHTAPGPIADGVSPHAHCSWRWCSRWWVPSMPFPGVHRLPRPHSRQASVKRCCAT